MTDLQKQQIEHLRRQGESYAAIAATLDVSVNTVKSYCRRNNIAAAASPIQHPATTVCEMCGCNLKQKEGAKPRRFCSDICRMAWWKAHPESVNRKAIYHFVCPTCGVAFESYGNAHRKYCSRACFGAAMRASV